MRPPHRISVFPRNSFLPGVAAGCPFGVPDWCARQAHELAPSLFLDPLHITLLPARSRWFLYDDSHIYPETRHFGFSQVRKSFCDGFVKPGFFEAGHGGF